MVMITQRTYFKTVTSIKPALAVILVACGKPFRSDNESEMVKKTAPESAVAFVVL